MGRSLSSIVDEIVAEAASDTNRRSAETAAIKVAEAMPKTAMARRIRALADDLRASSDVDVSYADFTGEP